MKAIQTFWTPPDQPVQHLAGGWLDPRYHFMSWALSASLLARHFEKVVLHTDINGRHILIDELALPYSEVHLVQEGLGKKYPKKWWVMRKILSYGLSDEPFIHVDGDAFLWNGLPESTLNMPLIAQNRQDGFMCYNVAVNQFKGAGIPLPGFIDPSLDAYPAVNMGVTGGTDYVFFKKYADIVGTFYDQHLSGREGSAEMTNTGYLNTLIEECFFALLAASENLPIAMLIDEKMDGGYASLANCLNQNYPVTHLIGENKQRIFYCKQVEFYLQKLFPDTFRRVAYFLEKYNFRQAPVKDKSTPDPFALSNALCKNSGEPAVFTFENYHSLSRKYRKQGKEQILKMSRFEMEKSRAIRNYLRNKSRFSMQQQNRFALVDRLMALPIRERLDDTLTYNEHAPVFRVRYPSQSVDSHCTLVYDFDFHYEHITHRSLDDLSLLILLNTEHPVTYRTLIGQFENRTGADLDADAPTPALVNLDLKIKEMILIGLLTYTFAQKPAEAC
ncbi:DUF6734 family protein [Dyadobacter crusticola]|uniref:DUF6734 family protein n=1 Tax=Dyadobacter crusticola TaxID=292407 RepID=UPI00054E0130|nr:DUF6734 family protein [Dyadobacter crusticola]